MSLEKDFKYFLSQKDELLKTYDGKFIVIANEKVVGVYDDEAEAYKDNIDKYGSGNFLIQKVSSGNQDYTATFHSRVIVN